MVLFDLYKQHPAIILDDCVTSEAAAQLTGYKIQHIRRLALAGKLEAVHVGWVWLIKVSSLERCLDVIVTAGDGCFGPRTRVKRQAPSWSILDVLHERPVVLSRIWQ